MYRCWASKGFGPLESRPHLRERSWIFSSETATAFLSFSEQSQKNWSSHRTLDAHIAKSQSVLQTRSRIASNQVVLDGVPEKGLQLLR